MEKKQQLEVYIEQVSGKQPKLLSQDHKKLLKGFNSDERDFYQQIWSYHYSHPFAAIQRHIPKFYGILQLANDPQIKIVDQKHEKSTMIWLNHLAGRYKIRNGNNKFIMLQNLTYGWELPNIFDIKIGGRNVEGKRQKITKSVSQFFVRLNGCKMNFIYQKDQQVFLSKYYLVLATQANKLLEYLSLFFFDGRNVLLHTIKIICYKLSDLILSFKALRGLKFISSSICIIYDARHPEIADVKLLDFGRVAHCQHDYVDEQSMAGMQNIFDFLSALVELGQKNITKLKKLQEYYCKADITIVPESKKIKYGDNAEQSPTNS